jgi:magnesium transporter
MQKLMMSLPLAREGIHLGEHDEGDSRCRGLAARLLIFGMDAPKKRLLCRRMLVNCVAYEQGTKLADIDKSEISDYLQRPGCFVWVALVDATEAELEEMREEFDLHELAVEDARVGHQRPKIEEYGNSLFVVLRTIEVAGDELKLGEVDIFAGPNYILSVRHATERGFKDVRARCEREPELLRNGSGYVLYALMDAVVDRYFPVLDAVETELEAAGGAAIRRGLRRRAPTSRAVLREAEADRAKHATGPCSSTPGKLYGGRVPQVCSGLSEYFRDVTTTWCASTSRSIPRATRSPPRSR